MSKEPSEAWLRWGRRWPVAVLGLVVAIAAVIAVRFFSPIWTPQFRDANGHALPLSIAVAERWRVNGYEESVIIRGRDRSNPILIWLHGGPGSSETPILRVFNGVLENQFTVVYWDQRLAGQTLDPRRPPPRQLTVAEMLSDLDVVVDRSRTRLAKDKVLLVGHSWGTMLGTIYAARHPEKVSAYVGIGQMADKPQAERASYEFAVREATRRRDTKAEESLARNGPPPYRGDQIFVERHWLDKFGGVTHADLPQWKLMLIGLRSPEANWRDFWAADHGGLLGLRLLEPELLATNLDHTYTHFDVPVFMVAGRHDHVTDAALANAYFDRIRAPEKTFVWFEGSGHDPHLEEPAAFNDWMVRVVRPFVVAGLGRPQSEA